MIVNDDGIFAPGIKFLTEAARQFGEVLVVAPDAPRSGQSHAITLTSPLRLQEAGVEDGVRRFSCNGTPADCVKMAVKVILQGEHPDYVFSGINHGSNAASNAIYSGTIAGIVEGALSGVPSVGFSLLDH
ncbi:MAG: 5'/3'-nucleotidase SurE, partial [Bacteroidales bacterium]|nr:5'/3'-nucleotidase SurE [Bacteroidales bacterium]